MTPAIRVRGLTKVYGHGAATTRALDGIDLDVPAGAVTLLLGPSGSGKTTLLSVMGGILRATSGSVRLGPRELVGMPERELPRIRRDMVGFVFQGFNLFGTLTARQNVELAFDVKGITGPTVRSQATSLLEQVGLGDKLEAFPADLSGGQKQRVAIARALAGEPDVILADEPTASLDSHSGHTVMGLLRTLAHERQRAVVIVSHDARMLGYGDRLVHIEDGRIAAHEIRPNEGVPA